MPWWLRNVEGRRNSASLLKWSSSPVTASRAETPQLSKAGSASQPTFAARGRMRKGRRGAGDLVGPQVGRFAVGSSHFLLAAGPLGRMASSEDSSGAGMANPHAQVPGTASLSSTAGLLMQAACRK